MALALVLALEALTAASARAAIAWSDSDTGGVNGGLSFTVPRPGGTAAGDVMVACISARDTPAISTPIGSGWTAIVTTSNATAPGDTQTMFWRVAGTALADPGPYTFNLSSSQRASGGISSYSGVDTTTPINDFGGTTGSSTPSLTTTVANTMLVACFSDTGMGSIAFPPTMMERYDINSGGGANGEDTESADEPQAAIGPTGAKTSDTATTIAQLIALTPFVVATTSTSTSSTSSTSSSTSTSSTTSSTESTSTSTSSTTSSTEETTSSTSTSSTTSSTESTSTSTSSTTSSTEETTSSTSTSSTTSSTESTSTSTSSTTSTTGETTTSTTGETTTSTSSSSTTSTPASSTTSTTLGAHFQCYEVKRTAFASIAGVELVDEFGAFTTTVRRPVNVCVQADKNGENPGAPSQSEHLTDYRISRPSDFARIAGLRLEDQFGTLTVDAIKPDRLMVPSTVDVAAQPPPPVPTLDHFLCYKIRRGAGGSRFTAQPGISVVDQFGAGTITVLRPLKFCAAVDKAGEGIPAPGARLTCYRIRSGDGGPNGGLFITNQFGNQVYNIVKRRQFCVPSTVLPPAGSPTGAFVD